MAREQRRAPRIQPYVAPCRVQDGARRLSGYVTELGLSGARVASPAEPPAVGASVVLEIRLAHRLSYSRLPCEVKWVRRGGGPKHTHAFGVGFSGLSAEDRAVLESVVEEYRRRAAELA